MPLAWGWVSAGVMKPWPTSGPIMRSRSQKAREAMSSRNSLAASQRNLREGKGGLPKPASFGERRGRFNAETPRTQRKAQRRYFDAETRRKGASEEEECPHEWGHGSLEGYAT